MQTRETESGSDQFNLRGKKSELEHKSGRAEHGAEQIMVDGARKAQKLAGRGKPELETLAGLWAERASKNLDVSETEPSWYHWRFLNNLVKRVKG